MAISKITGNLERAGDEAERIARMVKLILDQGSPRNLPSSELRWPPIWPRACCAKRSMPSPAWM
jgi:hypothetical protein